MLLHQLAKNGVVAGADRYVIGAANPVQIEEAKATVAESTKAAILMYGENKQKYKQIKDDLDNNFSKGTEKYPTTVKRTVHLLNT